MLDEVSQNDNFKHEANSIHKGFAQAQSAAASTTLSSQENQLSKSKPTRLIPMSSYSSSDEETNASSSKRDATKQKHEQAQLRHDDDVEDEDDFNENEDNIYENQYNSNNKNINDDDDEDDDNFNNDDNDSDNFYDAIDSNQSTK